MKKSDPTLPTGTVTFLLTDVEGHSQLWEEHPTAMGGVIAHHDRLVEAAVSMHQGTLIKSKGEGDSTFSVFVRPTDAVLAAVDAQRALVSEPWPEKISLKVRAAIHTGEAELREGDYYGPTPNRCARLRDISHGGQIVTSHATRSLVADHLPDDVRLKDLGRHRLRDLSRSEQVFEVDTADLPSQFPPLRSLDVLPHNLPVQLSSFVGRNQEMAAVRKLLAATRLVTVTGVGGTGKTRLVLQVAADVLDGYADGVWLVDLESISDADMVVAAVAAAVGLRGQSGDPLVGGGGQTADLEVRLVDYLRSRNLLVIFDTCEHVVSSCARLCSLLLRSCPDLHVLATSREPLGIEGETTWRLPPLGVPAEGVALGPEELSGFEAVRLFLDRAALARPGFELSAQDAEAVAEICRRVDGIPLAIEMAAPWVRMLTCRQIASRLDNRLRVLRAGRGELDRRQTLHGSIEWSHEMLSVDEQVLFYRLSVFGGRFSLEAAEAICAGNGVDRTDVLDLISRLVDKSLVTVEEYGEEIWYRLLQVVRRYAHDRLEDAHEAAEYRDRFVQYFLDLAERFEPVGRQEVTTGGLSLQLEGEVDNFREILRWTLAERPRRAVQLAGALGPLWAREARAEEGLRWLKQSLSSAEDAHPIARARALIYATQLAWRQGDGNAARRFADEALVTSRETNAEPIVGFASFNFGWVSRHRGDFAQARDYLENALTVFQAIGDNVMIHGILLHLSAVLWSLDQFTESKRALEESLTVAHEAGLKDSSAWSLNYMALMHSHSEAQAARSLLEESLRLFRETGNDFGAAWTIGGVAWLELYDGNHVKAAPMFEEALNTLRRLRDDWCIGFAMCGLGASALRQGDSARARDLLGESLEIAARMGDDSGRSDALVQFAILEVVEGNFERAARLLGALDPFLLRASAQGWPGMSRVEEARVETRAALGDARLEELVEDGRRMTLGEAAAFTLETLGPTP